MKQSHNPPQTMNDSPDYIQWFSEAFKALEVTPSEVARKLGVENAKIYNIINGKFKPGYETVHQILTAYPRLNANWLLKGQKPILHKSGAEIIGDTTTNYVTLPLLSVSTSYNNPPSDMHNDTYSVISSNYREKITECVVIKLTDSSMAPRYPLGMKLLACPVAEKDWEYLNSTLILVLYRSTLVVRRVKENELIAKNYLTLYADSEDSGFVMVKREDIKSVWRIIDIVGVDSLP